MESTHLAGLIHPGWANLGRRLAEHRKLSRRALLPGAAAIAGGLAFGLPGRGSVFGLDGRAEAQGGADLANWPTVTPIKHVVILCQENRTFDHYFGAFAQSFGGHGGRAAGFDPNRLTYLDSAGRSYHPYHLSQYCDTDPDHSWEGSHAKWNGGRMDGWVTAEADQTIAIRYYLAADHIYHVQLAQAFCLGDHYFCSQIGPTLPNRLYLWSGTSGWDFLSPPSPANSLPYNNPSLTAPPPILSWPTMADILDAAGLPWKCYSVADGSVPSAIGAFNPLIFFSQILENPAKAARATADISEFFIDLFRGTLPAVSWIVTEATVSEHPPAPPDMGQLFVARVVDALMASSAWNSTALFLVYDEGGGYFDHVAPNILETVPGATARCERRGRTGFSRSNDCGIALGCSRLDVQGTGGPHLHTAIYRAQLHNAASPRFFADDRPRKTQSARPDESVQFPAAADLAAAPERRSAVRQSQPDRVDPQSGSDAGWVLDRGAQLAASPSRALTVGGGRISGGAT